MTSTKAKQINSTRFYGSKEHMFLFCFSDESDLEIIIPTDSDDDVPLHSKPKNEDVSTKKYLSPEMILTNNVI